MLSFVNPWLILALVLTAVIKGFVVKVNKKKTKDYYDSLVPIERKMVVSLS